MKRRGVVLGVLVGAGLAIGSCGGGGGPTDPIPTPLPPPVTIPSPSPTPVATSTITINAQGTVQPADIRIAVGQRVTFVNQHDRPHDMTSDPHPEHTNCPEINDAGNVFPGQSRQTAVFNAAKRCGFHDHGEPDNPRLRGSITVQ